MPAFAELKARLAATALHALLQLSGVHVGNTSLPAEELQRLVVELGNAEFKGNSYHLLQPNCDHFSSALCKRLTGPSQGHTHQELCSQAAL